MTYTKSAFYGALFGLGAIIPFYLFSAFPVPQATTVLGAQVSVPSAPGAGYFLFSTSTGNYLATNSTGLLFSTTSTDYWKTQQDFFSTTSASYFISLNQNNAWSTTSAIYFVHSSTTIPKTYTTNTFSLLQSFNAGFTAFASSTIGSGATTSGLTINGGATTTELTIMSGSNSISRILSTVAGHQTLSLPNTAGASTLINTTAIQTLSNKTLSLTNNTINGGTPLNFNNMFLSGASTTNLSVTNRSYFGGTSTTTIDSAGSITLPTAALLTAPYASSTAFSTAYASTSKLYADGLGCAAGSYITWSGGAFGCAVDQTTAGAAPFTFASTFSTSTAATSSSIWTSGLFFSSSTLAASQFPYASTTAFSVSGNSFLGTVTSGVWNGTSIGTAFTDAKVVSGTCSGGMITCSGTNPLAVVSSAFPWTANLAAVFWSQLSNSTTTQIHFGATGVSLSASSTSQFDTSSTTAATIGTLYTSVNSALLLAGAAPGKVSAYGGAAACSANNFVTTISAVGGTTCGTAAISGVNLGSNLNNHTAGTGLSGATYNGSTAITWALLSYVATSSAETNGQLAYWTTLNGTPAKLGSVATSAPTLSGAYSYSGTLGSFVGGTSGTLSAVERMSFTISTSSASFIGTTTKQIEIAYGETWNNMVCNTNAGTLNIDVYHATSHLNFYVGASSTPAFKTFSTNNTMTANDKVFVDIGTPASNPTYVTCTVKLTI